MPKEIENEDYEKISIKQGLETFREKQITLANTEDFTKECSQKTEVIEGMISNIDKRIDNALDKHDEIIEVIKDEKVPKGKGGVYEDPYYIINDTVSEYENRREWNALQLDYMSNTIKKLAKALQEAKGVQLSSQVLSGVKEMGQQFSAELTQRVDSMAEFYNDFSEKERAKILNTIEKLEQELRNRDEMIKELIKGRTIDVSSEVRALLSSGTVDVDAIASKVASAIESKVKTENDALVKMMPVSEPEPQKTDDDAPEEETTDTTDADDEKPEPAEEESELKWLGRSEAANVCGITPDKMSKWGAAGKVKRKTGRDGYYEYLIDVGRKKVVSPDDSDS
ncbi:hypothetical protein ACFL6S_18425 [Candidatus Poribacteria bacterium]